jgi:acyl-CoA reductase-like NAD-dependent aldehyde dehydrogenase
MPDSDSHAFIRRKDNMTSVTLELGGKSSTIVLADANLQQAAAGAANAIFFNQAKCAAQGHACMYSASTSTG